MTFVIYGEETSPTESRDTCIDHVIMWYVKKKIISNVTMTMIGHTLIGQF